MYRVTTYDKDRQTGEDKSVTQCVWLTNSTIRFLINGK